MAATASFALRVRRSLLDTFGSGRGASRAGPEVSRPGLAMPSTSAARLNRSSGRKCARPAAHVTKTGGETTSVQFAGIARSWPPS